MTMSHADSPVTGFRPFFNPATGEWITYTAIAEDNHGQLVRFAWRSVPGGVITEHIHPRQEERFTIVAGQAHFTLNGQEHVAGAMVPGGTWRARQFPAADRPDAGLAAGPISRAPD